MSRPIIPSAIAVPSSAPILAGYSIYEQLYVGAKTRVYRAVEEATQRSVIIKFLHQAHPTFNDLLQFRNQYTIAKHLTIPGSIRPYRLESCGTSYAIVMEDFGGISLRQYVQKHPLSWPEILAIALQVADILHDLYQYRVVHKDIKPANLLIHPESKHVKIIDFSIASLLPKETQEIQHPNGLEGTLAYLAPEQTGRMNRGIDYRADFYSFGVTLYELLTGELPFQSNDPLELVHCHLAKMPVPPHHLNPEIPPMVSAITLKLMAKNAEDRYQSALGLKHDLEQCLTQWNASWTIAEFELGQCDRSDRFLIPEKLYGRETEVQTLLEAFARVAHGCSEMMLVAGFSGIGKTAVINEVHKPITQQRGYFIKGKFDQFNRNIPLSAFVQALQDLMEQLLAESDTQLANWRSQLLDALGDNGQVLIEVIPDLEHLIGKQPPAPELSGTASQNRFNRLFQNFIEVFTTAEHPLVIFLDDLQWADSASLQLIKLLMNDQAHLLLLGAYRDNEVSLAHPFLLTVEELKKTGIIVHTLTLAALDFQDINQLVADTLTCSAERSRPLTELLMRKTEGNPFFTVQFLRALHEEGHLAFNGDRGYWECDIAQVNALSLTDDVVEFMAHQLQKLSGATQQVLKLAACIGNQFDLTTLAIVSEQSPTDAAIALWNAVQEGLILPTSQTYKFFQAERSELSNADQGINLTYRFLHDRVQQAAYSLIPEVHKQTTHLKIGQLLLNNTTSENREDQIFAIVNQLNMGRHLITYTGDRDQLLHLNLAAAQKAKLSTAYCAATRYLDICMESLPADAWQSQKTLTRTLYELAVEVTYLSTDYERMEQLAALFLANTDDLIEKVRVYELKILALRGQGQLRESLQLGLEVLQLLGIPFPETPTPGDIGQALQQTQQLWQGRSIASLLDAPAMTDPVKLAAMQILTRLVATAYQVASPLMPLFIFKQIELSILGGNCAIAPFAYADYGLVLCGVIGDLDAGYAFGQLALKLLDRFHSKEGICRTYFVVHTYTSHWKEALNSRLPFFQEAYQAGLDIGDLEDSALNAQMYCVNAYFAGHELPTLAAEMKTYQQGLLQLKQESSLQSQAICYQTVLNLLGQAEDCCQLVGEVYDEIQALPALQQVNNQTTLYYLYYNKLVLCYLFGDYAQAVRFAHLVESYEAAMPGMFVVPLFYFYRSLAMLALVTTGSNSEQTRMLEQVATYHAKLQHWADHAPMNHQHRVDLVEAERYRVLGQKAEAIDAYDRAIAGASANGYLQEEALANELAAYFYLAWGKEKVAAGYLQTAYHSYVRWGAKAKMDDLAHRYPHLLQPMLQPSVHSVNFLETLVSMEARNLSHGSYQTSHSSSSTINATLDFTTILKAAQSLSGTIQLDELLKQLTQIILHHSGGDRCILLLPHAGGDWRVGAIATSESSTCASVSLEDSDRLPIKLIQYVKNTQEVVVIDNLKTALPVIDHDLEQQNPKSLLCLPVLNQGKLLGILYLTNQATSGAFTKGHILILNFLCTQAAISLENARLYQDLQTYAQQLEESLEQLKISENRFQKLADNVPGLIYQICIQPDGTAMMTYVSSGCQALYEVPAEDLVSGKYSLRDFEHPDDQAAVFEAVVESAQALTPFQQEWRIVTPTGKTKWVKAASQPERRDDGALVWDGMLIDISDRKQAERVVLQKSQELEQALQNLQKAQIQMVQNEKMASLGNLVAGVAHEINNPVGFLNGSIGNVKDYVQDLLEHLELYQHHYPNVAAPIQDNANDIDLDFLIEDLPKLLDSMTGATDRIKSISTSLRTFSRADTEYKVSAQLHEGLDSTLLILKYRLKANEHRPAIEIIKDYGELPPIECFPGQLNQVFMNILANAIDVFDEAAQQTSFADLEANPQQITIQTTAIPEQNAVEIRLRDNGKGMTEEVRTRIFDHLFTTKGVGKGTGLGMAIAQQIVTETHAGYLTVQSELGQGSEFCIHLPITA